MTTTTTTAGPKLARIHTDAGFRPALLFQGRKFIRALTISDTGLRVDRMRSGDMTINPIEDYPLRRAVIRFRKAGRELGMSKEARALLRRAKNHHQGE